LRGFGPLGILAILVIFFGAAIGPIISAPLIVLWTWLSRTPWREIGYVRPRRWATAVPLAIVSGAFFKLFMKAVVMPLLGAEPLNRAYHYLAHNPAAVPGMIFAMVVGAGWGEETFFRGYLFERLGKVFGSSAAAKAVIVGFTAALFGVVHYPVQGLDGAVQATIVGLTFGTFFAVSGSLFPVMIAHAAFDLTALAIIYFDVEAKVAHIFFR
jgi:membrane protease YdiL (CAAX protease family)